MKFVLRCALLSLVSMGLHATVSDPVTNFTDLAQGKDAKKTFEKVIASKMPVVIKFFMKGCGPCRSTEAGFKKMAEDYTGKAQFITLDVIHFTEIANQYNIKGVPTWIIFAATKQLATVKGGGKLPELKQLLDSHIKS